MALKPCPACSREVSDSAAACPGCGHPLLQAEVPTVRDVLKSDAKGVMPWVLFMIVVAAAIMFAAIAIGSR